MQIAQLRTQPPTQPAQPAQPAQPRTVPLDWSPLESLICIFGTLLTVNCEPKRGGLNEAGVAATCSAAFKTGITRCGRSSTKPCASPCSLPNPNPSCSAAPSSASPPPSPSLPPPFSLSRCSFFCFFRRSSASFAFFFLSLLACALFFDEPENA